MKALKIPKGTERRVIQLVKSKDVTPVWKGKTFKGYTDELGNVYPGNNAVIAEWGRGTRGSPKLEDLQKKVALRWAKDLEQETGRLTSDQVFTWQLDEAMNLSRKELMEELKKK